MKEIVIKEKFARPYKLTIDEEVKITTMCEEKIEQYNNTIKSLDTYDKGMGDFIYQSKLALINLFLKIENEQTI